MHRFGNKQKCRKMWKKLARSKEEIDWSISIAKSGGQIEVQIYRGLTLTGEVTREQKRPSTEEPLNHRTPDLHARDEPP
jgi:hypothetical protein